MISTPGMMERTGQITRGWISLCVTAGLRETLSTCSKSSWKMSQEDYGCHKLELLRDAREKVQSLQGTYFIPWHSSSLVLLTPQIPLVGCFTSSQWPHLTSPGTPCCSSGFPLPSQCEMSHTAEGRFVY